MMEVSLVKFWKDTFIWRLSAPNYSSFIAIWLWGHGFLQVLVLKSLHLIYPLPLQHNINVNGCVKMVETRECLLMFPPPKKKILIVCGHSSHRIHKLYAVVMVEQGHNSVSMISISKISIIYNICTYSWLRCIHPIKRFFIASKWHNVLKYIEHSN